MVKIYLHSNITELKDIQTIFRKLAKKLSKKCLGLDINLAGKEIHLQEEDQAEEFLYTFFLSENFEQYHFMQETGFWFDLKQLRSVCSIQAILGEKDTASKPIHNFRTRYPESKHKAEYDYLRGYSGKNLKQFREEVPEGDPHNPKSRMADVFDYNQLPSEARHTILNAMDVNVCPYCNMNYTIHYQEDGKVRNTADVDHFYVKDRHPEYALCLYNMIPACPVCNSRMKLDRDMTKEKHIYPHAESFEGTVDFEISNLVPYLLNQDTAAELKLEPVEGADSGKAERAARSEKLFQLENRYQAVHGYAEELVRKAQIYTENYSEELEQQFSDIFHETPIREMAFGPNETEKEYAQRSLGKLRMDLLHQLGIYK